MKNTGSDTIPRRQSDHLSNLRSFQTRASLNIVKNELFPDVVHFLSAEKSPKIENSEANELQMVINEEEEGKNEDNDTESKSPSNHGNDSKEAEKKSIKANIFNFKIYL